MERFWASALGRPFPSELEGDMPCSDGPYRTQRAILPLASQPHTPYPGLIRRGKLKYLPALLAYVYR